MSMSKTNRGGRRRRSRREGGGGGSRRKTQRRSKRQSRNFRTEKYNDRNKKLRKWAQQKNGGNRGKNQ